VAHFRIGPVELDEPRRELSAGGAVVAVEPKIFDVLLHLIRHRDRVVGKDELLDRFWPDDGVGDGALAVCVHRARRLLASVGAGEGLIRNVPRRGYRFVGAVETVEPSAPVTRPRRAGLYGRADQLGRLRAALTRASDGTPAVVLLAGERGIGKTRLAEEIAAVATADGFGLVWLDGEGAENPTAFARWRDAIARYLARYGAGDLASALAEALGPLVKLVPSVRGVLHDYTPDPRQYERPALRAAVVRFLEWASATRPLALVLDDLHEADGPSIEVLSALLRAGSRARLAVVATLATGVPASRSDQLGALDELRSVAEVIDVPRLPPEPAGLLVDEHVAGATVPESVRQAVIERGEGHPFVLVELCRSVARPGAAWSDEPDVPGIPAGVSKLLRERLQTLSPACRRMLGAASVCGRDFARGLLARLEVVRDVDLDAALAEARAAGVVERTTDDGGWRFAHGFFHEHLYQGLPDEERAGLHRAIGRVLEADGDDERWLAELAHHSRLGVDRATAARAAEYAYRLGLRDFALGDFAGAIERFEASLAITAAFPAEACTVRWEVYLALVESSIRVGDDSRARGTLRLALGSAGGDVELGGPTSIDVGAVPIEVPRLIAIWQSALVQPDGSYAAMEDARRLSIQQATSSARERGDVLGLVLAMLGERWGAADGQQFRYRLTLSSEACRLAEAIGQPHLHQEAALLRIHDLLENGLVDEAEREIVAHGRRAEALQEPLGLWVAKYLVVTRALLHGRFAEASERGSEVFNAGIPEATLLTQSTAMTQTMGVLTGRGLTNAVVPLLEMFSQQFPDMLLARASLARMFCEEGRIDEARALLATIAVPALEATPVARVLWGGAVAALARACAYLGDATKGAALLERLEPYRESHVVSPPAVVWVGSNVTSIAFCAAAAGKWRLALDAFDDSFARHERAGAHWLNAHTSFELARLLFRRDERGDRTRGLELLAGAEAVSQDIGMDGLSAAIDALRSSL